jgi:hypothetical protein
MVVGSTKLPRYLLRDGRIFSGLSISNDSATVSVSALYGFSDKPQYDLYLTQCTRTLTPYPLVKGYLKNQIEASPDSLQLVVLDAATPNQDVLDAATMQAIVDALNLNLPTVAISHHLTLDASTATYRVGTNHDCSTNKVPH